MPIRYVRPDFKIQERDDPREIRAKVTGKVPKDGFVEVSVTDTGIGILG